VAGLRNELRWSKSRGVVFRECLRKYYLRYYGAWEGWKSTAPEEARRSYRFSKMLTLATLAGQAVHQEIARHLNAIRRGESAPIDAEGAVAWMRRVWKDTEQKLYLKNPKRHPPLMEIYYDCLPPEEKRRAFAQRVRDCLDAFARSAVYAEIARGGPESWLWVERDDDTFDPRTIFSIEWDEAFGSPDFVRQEHDRLEIYDWKTGVETPEDEVQVTVYAAWAVEQLQAPPDAIEGRLVYLNDGARVERVTITPNDIENVRRLIQDELGQMKRLLLDAQSNTPQPMEHFPQTDDRALCRRCEYREVCFPAGVHS
jgi:CRISPR/Cas system-associated exonuclease Cas4 (RecB family)